MSSVGFNDKTRWIWTPDASHSANNYTCFRHTFKLTPPLQSARILITADARYEMFINGEWLGNGPPRSWTTPWPVDQYDVARAMKPGDNVIAVLVHDIGVSTFQYILGAPGLIAELELHDQKGHRYVVTNSSWQCKAHQGYAWPVPRISCQQGWEEQFDARTPNGLNGWKHVDYDDSNWGEADVRGRAGEPPHSELEHRDIPLLTRESVSPKRFVRAETVQPADHTWHLAPRALLNPSDKTANRFQGRLLLASHIHSTTDQSIELQTLGNGTWKLNGQKLVFNDTHSHYVDQGVAHASLQKGWNTLLCRMPEMSHQWWVSINLWTEDKILFSARPEIDFKGSPWLAVGPFATDEKSAQTALEEIIAANEIRESATSDRYERIWDNGMIDEDIMRAPFTRLLGPDMYTDVDVSAITTSDRPTDAEKISTRNETAMLCNNEEWTTIHPPDTEADVRLLLDFGDELVGYHEFEVDAPDGTIIDNQNFEFIQRDGRYNLAEGMNNSFRYVCREGVQRYRTFVRRGFRYSWLVLRNFNRPVRIRFVKAISSTYPMTGEGNFDSSDTVLGQLWDVGAHTLECCAEDTYTDCPTYEQTHWVGDARHEALIDLVANGDPRLSKHCWLQAARSLDRSPMVESHVPSGWSCILTAWSLLWMRWAQEHFMLTGDKELAQNMLRYIERNVCGIEQHINEDNLLEINAWNMLDWADMDTPDNGIVTHQNCLTVVGLRQAAELALHVGQKGRAQRWNALADRVSYAIDEHLWAEDNRAYIDCIHPNGTRSEVLSEQTQCMAYLANLPSDTRRQRCLDVVLDPPDGFVSAGSPFYMFFALESMAQSGHYTTLLDTIREYWTPQLEAGATTFWEAFWADRDRKTRSHCHAWSAAPTYFLPREILGIKPCTPGYDTVLIAPHPCDLAWAHGRVPTPHGTVECAWENRENTFNMNLRMPDGIEGRVQLPYEGTLDVERGDAHTTSSPDNEIHLECKGPGITICLRDKHPKRHSE